MLHCHLFDSLLLSGTTLHCKTPIIPEKKKEKEKKDKKKEKMFFSSCYYEFRHLCDGPLSYNGGLKYEETDMEERTCYPHILDSRNISEF